MKGSNHIPLYNSKSKENGDRKKNGQSFLFFILDFVQFIYYI